MIFLHRLGLAVGEADIDKLAGELDIPTVYRWIDYDEIEPFGETRADLRAAIVASTVENAVAAATGSKQRVKVKQFMPEFGPRTKRETMITDPKHIEALFARQFGGSR